MDLAAPPFWRKIRETPECGIIRAVFTPTIDSAALYLHLPSVLSAVIPAVRSGTCRSPTHSLRWPAAGFTMCPEVSR